MAQDNGWKFDRHVSVGHIVTTLMVVAGLFVWAGEIDQRINDNRHEIQKEKELRKIEADHIRQTVDSIDDKVDKNGLKLDRLLERVNGRGE